MSFILYQKMIQNFCAFEIEILLLLKLSLHLIEKWRNNIFRSKFFLFPYWRMNTTFAENQKGLNPKETGGGGGGGGHDGPPLDISRDYSATREALAATLYDNFLSSFPHIFTPNLWRPGVRFRKYVTLCTCTSDRKWLQNVILCTKSMQIKFFHLVHINMLIFTLNCWN